MTARFGTAQRKAKRNQLRMRDGDNCWLCGEPMRFLGGDGLDPEFATLDHVIPKSDGGTRVLSNLRLAHGRCNRARGNAPAIADRFPGGAETGTGSGRAATRAAVPEGQSPNPYLPSEQP